MPTKTLDKIINDRSSENGSWTRPTLLHTTAITGRCGGVTAEGRLHQRKNTIPPTQLKKGNHNHISSQPGYHWRTNGRAQMRRIKEGRKGPAYKTPTRQYDNKWGDEGGAVPTYLYSRQMCTKTVSVCYAANSLLRNGETAGRKTVERELGPVSYTHLTLPTKA